MSDAKLLGVNVKYLKFISLWPNENETELVGCVKKIFQLLSYFPYVFGLLMELVREIKGYRDNSMSLFTVVQVLMQALIIYITIIILYLRRRNLLNLIPKLNELQNNTNPQRILKTKRRIGFYAHLSFVLSVLVVFVFALFTQLSISSCEKLKTESIHMKHLPCGLNSPIWTPFDLNNKMNYNLFSIYTLYFMMSFAIIVTSSMCFYFCFVIYLLEHIEQLKSLVHSSINSNDYDLFKICIRFHCQIISISQYFDDCFSLFSLSLIFLSSTLLGILGFQTSLASDFFESLRYFLHLLTWLLYLYGITYFSQKLCDVSLSIGEELYLSKWSERSVTFQLDILCMLRRTQKPLMLSTGPIGVFNLGTFIKIIRIAYSFFALFLNTKYDK